MEFGPTIETIGQLLDLVGVGTIILGVLIVTVNFIRQSAATGVSNAYLGFRQGLGKALLLGLELLVAADIIRTVAVTPTLQSVIVLAFIVAIRTFLSWALEVEINGRWPWQQKGDEHNPTL